MILSSSTPEGWADVPAVVEKYAEVLSLYSKAHAVTLELEASLKLAGYHAWFGRKIQALDLLMHAHALSTECSTQERVIRFCPFYSNLSPFLIPTFVGDRSSYAVPSPGFAGD